MDLKPIRFIEESIEVTFQELPIIEKKPPCPDGFTWRNQKYEIIEILSEWRDYSRKGKMSNNMQPQHATIALKRGSWGVGLFYFRVIVQTKQVFDIYYDRSPIDVDRRKGIWFIYRELESLDHPDNEPPSPTNRKG